MVAPRYAGTEPLTEEMLNSMFGRECDGSYTDPWESVEGVHGELSEAQPVAAEIAKEVAKADARVKAWDESVARVQEMCRKFKHIKC